MPILDRTPLPHVVDLLARETARYDYNHTRFIPNDAVNLFNDLQGTWLGRDILTRRFEVAHEYRTPPHKLLNPLAGFAIAARQLSTAMRGLQAQLEPAGVAIARLAQAFNELGYTER